MKEHTIIGGIDILFVKIGSFLMTGQPFIKVGGA